MKGYLLYIKLYYEATVIKLLWYQGNIRQIEQNQYQKSYENILDIKDNFPVFKEKEFIQ